MNTRTAKADDPMWTLVMLPTGFLGRGRTTALNKPREAAGENEVPPVKGHTP